MSKFPIPDIEQLPTRITPCPIVAATLEIRFVTIERWSVLPGLLFQQIRDRCQKTEDLPLAQIPEDVRNREPNLIHKPLMRFVGEKFVIQFGPRVVSLIAGPDYPGWTALFEELKWLLAKLRAADFIEEGERLGIRYVDFFELDLFSELVVELRSAGEPISGVEMAFTTAFRQEGFLAKLVINNGVSLKVGDSARQGSVFDLDLAVPASEFDLFDNGLDLFRRAHNTNKRVFFGLLKPEFLATLSPEYE